MTESCMSEVLARLIGLGISAVRSVTFFCHIHGGIAIGRFSSILFLLYRFLRIVLYGSGSAAVHSQSLKHEVLL